MTTEQLEINSETNNGKWTCKHCLRSYSKNYKHKKHLEKCLVYQERCNIEYDVMLELKNELKEKFVTIFQNMMLELKNDMSRQNVGPTQRKPIIGQFV
jgi:hypothetical protein